MAATGALSCGGLAVDLAIGCPCPMCCSWLQFKLLWSRLWECQKGVLSEEALIFHLNIYLLIRFFFLLLQLYSYSSQKTCKDEKFEGSKCSLLITKDGINWVIRENFKCQYWMMSLLQNLHSVGNAYRRMGSWSPNPLCKLVTLVKALKQLTWWESVKIL